MATGRRCTLTVVADHYSISCTVLLNRSGLLQDPTWCWVQLQKIAPLSFDSKTQRLLTIPSRNSASIYGFHLGLNNVRFQLSSGFNVLANFQKALLA